MVKSSRHRFDYRAFAFIATFYCLSIFPSRHLFAATSEQIDTMLEKAKKFVYAQQKGGLWETLPTPPSADDVAANPTKSIGGQWGGDTALAVYALLAAGESPQDPRLVPAIKFLMTADIKGTYALGLRAQMYPFLPLSPEVTKAATADAGRFQDALFAGGKAKGLFDALLKPKSRVHFDHRISQYGVLGMWACERAGAEVSTDFWKAVEDGWTRDQNKTDGSWAFLKDATGKYPADASITAAGVATLSITQDYVHADAGINCTGNIDNKHIDAGMKWLSDNFEHIVSDKSAEAIYHGLFGVEFAGAASGRKYLGTVDWYQNGSDFLLKKQYSKGNWSSTPNTCLAMLFLSRGRAPVVMNKLQYDVAGKEGNWNERPRDAANLVHWISKETESELNWQIVTLQSPMNEMLEAPILYVSGNKPLSFKADEEKKLRDYCQAGGLIVANPDGGSKDFADSFRKLGSKLFPDYEFRELPPNHPIYTNQQYPRSTWKTPPVVLSLSNGVRELMMITPADDLARHWQLEELGHYRPMFELVDDVFLYAVDKKNFSEKGKTFYVTPTDSISTNRTIKLARLQYAGNWDPEPGGWRRLMALLHNKSHIQLDISVANLGFGQLGDGKTGATVAALTGTAAVKFDTSTRQELKNFIEGGGTLIVDAAGGNSDFAASAESELEAILGPDAAMGLKTPMPASSKIFTRSDGAIKEFVYRSFARSTVGTVHGPMLARAMIGKRPAVYFSRLDLNAGLVGQPTDGIVGYDPATATAIMTNVVIAAGLGPSASIAPTK